VCFTNILLHLWQGLGAVGRTIELPVLPDALLGAACAAGSGGDTDSQAGTSLLQGQEDARSSSLVCCRAPCSKASLQAGVLSLLCWPILC
jgi:hypothetical protein